MFDVVVVGAGPAGIACSLAAAERGRRVILLEKSARIGGALHWSGGHLSAAGTRRQVERGIKDGIEAHLEDIERISRGTARMDITRRCVEEAVPTVEWLEDQGFAYDPATPRIVYGHEPYRTPRTVHGLDGGASVLAVLAPLLDRAVTEGSIQLRTDFSVTELLRGPKGIEGVLGPKRVQVRGDAVVLATGGFGHDPALFAELDGAPLVTSASPTATGDGIRLARSVGAAVAGRGMYLPTFGGLPPEPGEVRVDWDHRPQLVAPERPPYEIYVDRSGARWVDENDASIDLKERALMRLEAMTFWQVFDARALANSRPIVHGWSPEELHAACGNRLGVERAADLEGLANRSGIDPDGLIASVQRYNTMVRDGADSDFGRTFLPAPIQVPPFYAIENHPVTLITFAGVDVTVDLEVRRDDKSVVNGLYAVGEVIGSAAYNGNSFCSGMSLTPALALGRWLGGRI